MPRPGRDDHHRRLQPRARRSAARADGRAVRRRHAAARRCLGGRASRRSPIRRRSTSTRRRSPATRSCIATSSSSATACGPGCGRVRVDTQDAGLRPPAGDPDAGAEPGSPPLWRGRAAGRLQFRVRRGPCRGAPSRRPPRLDLAHASAAAASRSPASASCRRCAARSGTSTGIATRAVAPLAAGKRVLDAACGEGYGSYPARPRRRAR